MKKNKFLGLILATSSLVSCSDYFDINSNPSFPQEAPAQALLAPIFQEMAAGELFDSRFIGKYVQNWGEVTANQVWDQHGYNALSDNGGQLWRSHYWAIGTNIDRIIADGNATQKWWYSGAAKAIRAWSWQTTTDYHGEIILTQAWEPNRYVFAYNDQSDVYTEVVRLCQDALVDLDKDDQSNLLKVGDIVYKGDRDKWKKFVYSVLARNAHHLSNKSTYNADKVIEYVDKSFTSNADNFNVPHAGTNSVDGNFLGPLRNNLGTYRQTAFALSLVNGTVFAGAIDPRLGIIFSASTDGTYNGVTPGIGDPNSAATNVKRVPNPWGTYVSPSPTGKYIFNNSENFPIMTYSELQFIKAEAALIKGDNATALAAYINGINAHFDFVAPYAANAATFTAARTAYMANVNVVPTAANLTKSKIMLQKYVSLYAHGIIETWVDMRRYHYDPAIYTGFALPATLFADNGGKPAYRVRPRYNSEYVYNLTSLSVYGGDKPDYHTYEQWFTKPE